MLVPQKRQVSRLNPLAIKTTTMENCPFIDDLAWFTHWTWWSYIAMWNDSDVARFTSFHSSRIPTATSARRLERFFSAVAGATVVNRRVIVTIANCGRCLWHWRFDYYLIFFVGGWFALVPLFLAIGLFIIDYHAGYGWIRRFFFRAYHSTGLVSRVTSSGFLNQDY